MVLFHVLRARTRFRRYRGRRVPFSCFARSDSFFEVLHTRTRFRRNRGHRVPFSYFARPDSFSSEPRASGPVLTFCAHGLIFGGTVGVGSRFHVLRPRTHFRRYRGLIFGGIVSMFCPSGLIFGGIEGVGSRFRCFARQDSFSAMSSASGPVFMFCVPVLGFSGNEGVGSRFHFLLSRTHFRRYRGCRVLFSCSARPDWFSAVRRASGPVLMFCLPGLFFGRTEGI
jgi:hypothetical protein